MASSVDICNLALGRLGIDQNLNSLDQNTRNARMCRKFYDPLRKSVLREHDWIFAEAIVSLALASDEEHPDYEFAYGYPSNCLKAKRIINVNGKAVLDYEVSLSASGTKKILYTNVESAQLAYTVDITDANVFDDNFIDALAWRITAELAVPIKGSPSTGQYSQEQYTKILSKAKVVDRSEGHTKPHQGSSILDSRK